MVSLDESSDDAASYGARLADRYDDIYGGVFDTDGAVDFLAKLASGGAFSSLGWDRPDRHTACGTRS